jgi:alkyl hydroperoxide reductase subunit D
MNWINVVKEGLPDYAKDTKLNLDAVLLRSSLDPLVAQGCALAAAFAAGNSRLATAIDAEFEDRKEADAALTAAAIMAQNNVWYPYVEMVNDPLLSAIPPILRMNGIINHGGSTKERFEAYSLAASIVGKCEYCVKAHFTSLKGLGYTYEQLRDVGRIAAVINSVSKVLGG